MLASISIDRSEISFNLFESLYYDNLIIKKRIYDFQRWMSWFSQRWRTQRNAICNVNCRLSESSNLWTHIALPISVGSIPIWVFVNLTSRLIIVIINVRVFGLILCFVVWNERLTWRISEIWIEWLINLCWFLQFLFFLLNFLNQTSN